MAEHVKVLVDLSKGSVEVEAPVDSLKEIFAELSALLPKLDMHGKIATSNDVNPRPNTSDDEATPVKPKRPAKKRKAVQKKSPEAAGGDLGTWNYADFVPFDLGLSAKDALAVRAEYQEKAPSVAWEKALTALFLLKKYCSKEGCRYDDIFQMLRDGEEDKIPKNMSGEITKLVDKNFALKSDDGIKIKILGSEYVENSLKKLDQYGH